jgi:hypothetical protein
LLLLLATLGWLALLRLTALLLFLLLLLLLFLLLLLAALWWLTLLRLTALLLAALWWLTLLRLTTLWWLTALRPAFLLRSLLSFAFAFLARIVVVVLRHDDRALIGARGGGVGRGAPLRQRKRRQHRAGEQEIARLLHDVCDL